MELKGMDRIFVRRAAATFSICIGSVLGVAEEHPRVGRFEMHEVALTATGQYANPYSDLEAELSLSPPAGGGNKRVLPLFWDGGATWKFRFSPDQPGIWNWTVSSRDAGLSGKSGSLEVVASNRQGSIRPMPGFPRQFERQDGTTFWFLGDTAWALYYDRADEKYDRDAALAYIDARAAQGFNVLHSSLLSELGWGNRSGMPFDDITAEK